MKETWVSHTRAQRWYLRGEHHREDGPATTLPDGSKYWIQHGELHRTDGPAEILPSGRVGWWYEGELYGEEEWKDLVTQ